MNACNISIHSGQQIKQHKWPSISEWIGRHPYNGTDVAVHPCNGILSHNEKEWTIDTLKNTAKSERHTLSTRSQSQKDTYYNIPFMTVGKEKLQGPRTD